MIELGVALTLTAVDCVFTTERDVQKFMFRSKCDQCFLFIGLDDGVDRGLHTFLRQIYVMTGEAMATVSASRFYHGGGTPTVLPLSRLTGSRQIRRSWISPFHTLWILCNIFVT